MTLETKKAPQLVVFDLDYTLWPFWVDTDVRFPVYQKQHEIRDLRRRLVSHYPEVPQVLQLLKTSDISMAVASRTIERKGANKLMNLFGWDDYFTFKEIYPGRKIFHFDKLRRSSGLPYSSMLFFDDDYRNIKDVSELGVLCVHVKNGVSLELVKKGLEAFALRR